MNLDDAIIEISRARRRLDAEQGRLARKNARAAVKAAVATALRALDREFPTIAKERVVRVSMSPLAKKRRQRAKRIAFVLVSNEEALALAKLGVKLLGSEPETLTYKSPNGASTTAKSNTNHFAPNWIVRAYRAGIAPVEIKRAFSSRSVRARIEAMVRLRSNPLRTAPIP